MIVYGVGKHEVTAWIDAYEDMQGVRQRVYCLAPSDNPCRLGVQKGAPTCHIANKLFESNWKSDLYEHAQSLSTPGQVVNGRYTLAYNCYEWDVDNNVASLSDPGEVVTVHESRRPL